MKKKGDYIIKILSIFGLLVFPTLIVAQTGIARVGGFGEMAEGITGGPILFLRQFMYGVSYVASIFFLFKAYEQFKAHKMKPEMSSISAVFFLFALGIVLFLLPLSHYLVERFY